MTTERTINLAEALVNEQQRVKELLPLYDAVQAGVFASTMMRKSLELSEQAAASGDTTSMISAYLDLRSYD